MNPEAVLNQRVVLVCEDCGTKTDAKTRDEHVDEGWNWQEFEINDVGIEQVALCPECFDSEKLVLAIEDYRQKRIVQNQSLDDFSSTPGDNE